VHKNDAKNYILLDSTLHDVLLSICVFVVKPLQDTGDQSESEICNLKSSISFLYLISKHLFNHIRIRFVPATKVLNRERHLDVT
jgi:hypothetical protein